MCIYIYIHIHYITLHYVMLHYTTLHYITLHYITYIYRDIHVFVGIEQGNIIDGYLSPTFYGYDVSCVYDGVKPAVLLCCSHHAFHHFKEKWDMYGIEVKNSGGKQGQYDEKCIC